MRQQSIIISIITFINIKLIKPSIRTKYNNFNKINIRYNCVIKLPFLKDKEISL